MISDTEWRAFLASFGIDEVEIELFIASVISGQPWDQQSYCGDYFQEWYLFEPESFRIQVDAVGFSHWLEVEEHQHYVSTYPRPNPPMNF